MKLALAWLWAPFAHHFQSRMHNKQMWSPAMGHGRSFSQCRQPKNSGCWFVPALISLCCSDSGPLKSDSRSSSLACWMPSGAVFASSAGFFEVSVTFLETVVVEMVMTVVVVVLCAELSTTGGATVTRLWWPESTCIQFGCSGMGVGCAALVV